MYMHYPSRWWPNRGLLLGTFRRAMDYKHTLIMTLNQTPVLCSELCRAIELRASVIRESEMWFVLALEVGVELRGASKGVGSKLTTLPHKGSVVVANMETPAAVARASSCTPSLSNV